MPETHLKSPLAMPKSTHKSLKASTLMQSIRCNFSLRRRLGCSSSSAAAIRMSANWRPGEQPRTQPNIKNKKTTKPMSKQRKIVVATTRVASTARNRLHHHHHHQQQFVDIESPPLLPSPASDSVFSSNKSFRNRRQPDAGDTVNNTEVQTRSGRGTSPMSAAALDFESVFRIPHSGTEDFATRYQHRPRQRTPEELAEILAVKTSILMRRSDYSHDQFRDWRLDTDDMTYEQLLALGDKMGYVSTGLKESEILRCIKKTKFLGKKLPPVADDAEPKCCICQEEYEPKDKLGLLICAHFYHRDCIMQWLRHKKTCPVCKSEVISGQR